MTAATDRLVDIAELAAPFYGDIHSVQDGVVTVTVGATRSVGMALTKAINFALAVSQHCEAIGVYSGSALVGEAGAQVMLGRVAGGAAVMRVLSSVAGVDIAVGAAAYAELFPLFNLATVDVVALPWEDGRPVRVVGVWGQKGDTGEEWLYSFEQRNGLETAWTEVLEGRSDVNITPQDEPAVVATKECATEDATYDCQGRALKASRSMLERIVHGGALGQAQGHATKRCLEMAEWAFTQKKPILF